MYEYLVVKYPIEVMLNCKLRYTHNGVVTSSGLLLKALKKVYLVSGTYHPAMDG